MALRKVLLTGFIAIDLALYAMLSYNTTPMFVAGLTTGWILGGLAIGLWMAMEQ